MKTFLITGTSTGLGHALALEVLAAGHNLIATARNKAKIQDLVDAAPDRVLAADLEITDTANINDVVETAIERFGRIDVLVNNAGYGLQGAIEEASPEEVYRQFDVNVFGLLSITQAVLPYMRQQGSGHIINISSVAGMVSSPGLGIYNGSKHAVEGISEALAAEVAPLGIKVTIIEPGPFRTEWASGNMIRTAASIESYNTTAGATDQMLQSIVGRQPGDPAKAARAMLKVVEDPNPPLRLPLGQSALDRIRKKLETVKQELDKWEDVILDTAFTE